MPRIRLAVIGLVTGMSLAGAADWPMAGRDSSRNAVSPEKTPPTSWQVDLQARDGTVSKKARNIKWSARLGSRSLGGPVIADGLVWVGTNNQNPRDPKRRGDASVLMCFRESDGQLLWQYVSPRLEKAFIEDYYQHSMGSPLVAGDRLWLMTNRCEALCLDTSPLKKGTGDPRQVWKVDMRQEFGVMANSAIMAQGFSPSMAAHKDWVYAVTGNGVNEESTSVPAPTAPSLICFEKHTGKVVWKDNSPGKNILHAQRSTPLAVTVEGKGQVIVGQGDGWLRSFDPATGKVLWKCDLNRKDARYELGGQGGRNYVMATPVYAGGRVYIATGRDPEQYAGEGCLYCIDPTRQGDISVDVEEQPGKAKPNPNSGVIWHTLRGPLTKEQAKEWDRDYAFGRTISACVVVDDLVYAADIEGYFHCFDARIGKLHWRYDFKAMPWGAPLWIDGKVYLATDDGDVLIFESGKKKADPAKVEMETAIHTAPVFANGVLYVATESRLYAIQEKK